LIPTTGLDEPDPVVLARALVSSPIGRAVAGGGRVHFHRHFPIFCHDTLEALDLRWIDSQRHPRTILADALHGSLAIKHASLGFF